MAFVTSILNTNQMHKINKYNTRINCIRYKYIIIIPNNELFAFENTYIK